MTILITTLKSEIARVARKELKEELLAIRKSTMTHRAEIAALKRQFKSLAAELKAITRGAGAKSHPLLDSSEPAVSPGIRFSAQRLAKYRSKMGITQSQMATLLDVSYLSVHKWESGASTPRSAQLQKIAAAMKMGKREVTKKLGE